MDPAVRPEDKLKGMTADGAVRMVRELAAQLGGGAESFHGNIWPGNVRFDEEQKAVLGEGSDAPVSQREAAQVEYLAPEFFWDGEGSAAADVYSLGLLLFAGCTGGYLPFQPRGGALTDKDRSGALRKRMKGEAIHAPRGVTKELGAVIRKALAYEPENRYASAAELLYALGYTDEALPAADTLEDAPIEAPITAEEAELPASETEVAGMPKPAAEESVSEESEATEAVFAEVAPEAEEEPAAEEASPEEPAAPMPKYTVQKDFEKNAAERRNTEAPSSRRKKKISPAIPILCVAAVIVIAAVAAVLLHQNQNQPQTKPEQTVSEPFVITPAAELPEETELPQPADELTGPGPDGTDPEPLEETEDEPAVTGSESVNGLAVTPQNDTVYLTGSGVNLRSGPSTTYAIAITLPRGTELKRTGVVNGWSQVQYEGGEYYVSNTMISATNPNDGDGAVTGTALTASVNTTEKNDSVTVTEDANLRKGPGTNYDRITTVPAGTELKRTGTTDNGWSRVEYNGAEAYIAGNLITTDSGTVSENTGTVKVISKVNVRSGPGTGYDRIGVADVGTVLTTTGVVDGKWYRVTFDGKVGYVNRNLIEVQGSTSDSGTLTITSPAQIRKGPGTGYDSLGVAEAGTTLTVTGAEGNWYKVTYKDQTGYVNGNLTDRR